MTVIGQVVETDIRSLMVPRGQHTAPTNIPNHIKSSLCTAISSFESSIKCITSQSLTRTLITTKIVYSPVFPTPLVPTTIMRIGRGFGLRPNLANDDFGDVEFIFDDEQSQIYG